jgi:hypothetical protein
LENGAVGRLERPDYQGGHAYGMAADNLYRLNRSMQHHLV